MKKTKIIELIPAIQIGLILFIALMLLVTSIVRDMESFRDFYGIQLNTIQLLKAFFYSNHFIKPILLILAMVGFFIKNPLGWIAICNLFYFFMLELVFIIFPSYTTDWIDYLALLVPLGLVALMNVRQLRYKHKISAQSIVTVNLIPVLIGLSLVILEGYIHLNYELSTFELIDKIK